MRRAVLVFFASLVGLVAQARAQIPSCSDPAVAFVALRAIPADSNLPLDEIARHLAAGFASSNVAVCTGPTSSPRRIAELEVESESAPREGAALRIRVRDAVTSKFLERSVELATLPEDSRTLLVALYIEELVQASWIETRLRNRVHVPEPPPAIPPEVQREIAAVLPAAGQPAREPRLRLSFSGAFSYFETGLMLAGPELSFGFTLLRWLELSLRAGYRLAPAQTAPHGSIDTQALLGGLAIDAFWRANARLSLHFPLGMEAARVRFVGHADADAEGTQAIRAALLLTQGVGPRIALTPLLSLGAVARFCWTLLPAEAADEHDAVTGIAGIGGEGVITLDIHI